MENRRIEIFCCYSHKDHELLDKLKTHLASLRRRWPGSMDFWHDARMLPGSEWGREIYKHLNNANIILLLVSPDSIASDYWYGIEMQQAMKRHERGETQVIPIILRPTKWEDAPFAKLHALPKDAKPVTRWPDPDDAFLDIAKGISNVVETLLGQSPRSNPSSHPHYFSFSVSSSSDLIKFHGLESAVSPDNSRIAHVSIKNNWPTISIQNIKKNILRTYQIPRVNYNYLGKPGTIAWSPDGLHLVSSSCEGILYIWDRDSGKRVCEYRGHQHEMQTSKVWVSSLSWSPDGSYIASAAATVQIWDATTTVRLLTFSKHAPFMGSIFSRHPPHVTDVAWSPDSTRLVSVGNRSILVWDSIRGDIIHAHGSDSQQAVWSPDGSQIASADWGSVISVWDATTGSNVATYPGHKGRIEALAWSPDGSCIASQSTDSTIQIWEAKTGRPLFCTRKLGEGQTLPWSSRN